MITCHPKTISGVHLMEEGGDILPRVRPRDARHLLADGDLALLRHTHREGLRGGQ